MENNLALPGVLMILPVISCGIFAPIFRSDYNFDVKVGGWLKFHRVPQTWEQAHLTCQNEGAVLASPLNDNLSQALSIMMIQHGMVAAIIFTGISNTSSTSVFQFVEGVPISYTHTQFSENCVGMKIDGTISEAFCLDYHPFACYREEKNSDFTECGTTDSEYVLDNRTGSCYKVYREQHKWSEACTICAAQGGHLAVINSQVEAEIIWELAKDSLSEYALSIGFYEDVSGPRRNWVTVQDQFLEEAGYARWYEGEPNNYNENCGSVIFRGSKENGILNDVPCDMDLMFICEKNPNTLKNEGVQEDKKEEEQTTAQEVEITTLEPINREEGAKVLTECGTLDTEYVLNNRTGSCYKVYRDQHKWFDASDICAAQGGHLAVINSQDEAEIIWELAKGSLSEYGVFVGFRVGTGMGTHARTWVTVQNESLEEAGYAIWFEGEPNDPNENCGGVIFSELKENGILNDVPCDRDLMFICEKNPNTLKNTGIQEDKKDDEETTVQEVEITTLEPINREEGAIVLPECGTSDSEYMLDSRTGSCYKVYRDQHKWSDASDICAAQGGHLAVINSQDEAEIIWKLAKESQSGASVMIGFRAGTGMGTLSRTWITVQNQSLEEAGYARWFEREPNDPNENCGGVVFSGLKENGILNDVQCDMDLMFICEKNPNTLKNEGVQENKKEEEQTTAQEVEITTLEPINREEGAKILPECGTSDAEYMLDSRTGSCYKVYRDQHKWSDASDICAAQGGHLAVINSQDEAEVIWKLAKESQSGASVMIGFRAGTGMGTLSRTWITVQNQSLEEAGYARWFEREPNDPNENCGGVIFSGLKENGILNDVPCDMDLMFICEKNPNTLNNEGVQENKKEEEQTTVQEVEITTLEPINMEEGAKILPECGTSDTEYMLDTRTGSCYKVYRDQHKWSDASDICAAQGGHLAVINSQDEAEIIWKLAKESQSGASVMIGFRAGTGMGTLSRTWITVQNQSLEEAGYARWFEREPNDPNENCGGVIFSGLKENGILNDVPCDMDLMFICEKNPNTLKNEGVQENKKEEEQTTAQEVEITTVEPVNREEGAKILPDCGTLDAEYMLDSRTGSCYKVYRDQHKWSDASDICAAQGGHLAVINSQDEAEIIWKLAKESQSGASVMIGFRAGTGMGTLSRTWVTVENQSLEEAGYARWYGNEPNDPNENCGGVIFTGLKEYGILNDVPCDMALMFICENNPNTLKNTIEIPTLEPNNREVGALVLPDCGTSDAEYMLYSRIGSCYKVYRDQHKWSEASDICAAQGGHLAVINSQDEAEIIWKLAKESQSGLSVMIGFRAGTGMGTFSRTWVTVENQSLEQAGYARWYGNEPNDPNENCGGVIFTGLKEYGILNDVPCDMDLMFICENYPNTLKNTIEIPTLEPNNREVGALVLPDCGTSDAEYILDSRIGSCYKVYRDQHKWSEASNICAAQGGHLAVINSQYEAEIIWKLAKESQSALSVMIGFRAGTGMGTLSRTWVTVENQSLEEAGYARWYGNEPNDPNENCGGVIFTGLKEYGILNDVPCDMNLMFICEKNLY